MWAAYALRMTKPTAERADWFKQQVEAEMFSMMNICFQRTPGAQLPLPVKSAFAKMLNCFSKIFAVAATVCANKPEPSFIPVAEIWVDVVHLFADNAELQHFEAFMRRCSATNGPTTAALPVAKWLLGQMKLCRPHFDLYGKSRKRPAEDEHATEIKRHKQELADSQDQQQLMITHASNQSDYIAVIKAQLIKADILPAPHPNA
jgi:hypothetical protein